MFSGLCIGSGYASNFINPLQSADCRGFFFSGGQKGDKKNNIIRKSPKMGDLLVRRKYVIKHNRLGD